MIWLAVFVLLLISFVFAGIEAGMLSINRVRLKHRAKHGDPAALKLNRLLAHPERLLVTVVIVTNLANITAITLTAQVLVGKFGVTGFFVTLGLFLPIYLLGLELLPKSLFRRFPFRALAALTTPLQFADTILSPIHFAVNQLTHGLMKQRPAEQRKLFGAREDFKYLTFESERTGEITREEREMIQNVIDFRAITAEDVMVPMSQVQTIPASATLQEYLAKQRATKFDRWPVMGDDGKVTGWIDAFDLAMEGRTRGIVESFQRRIVRVSEREPAYAVLRKLRAARVTLALVSSSSGEALGIVTSEDLVYRLVSDAKRGEKRPVGLPAAG